MATPDDHTHESSEGIPGPKKRCISIFWWALLRQLARIKLRRAREPCPTTSPLAQRHPSPRRLRKRQRASRPPIPTLHIGVCEVAPTPFPIGPPAPWGFDFSLPFETVTEEYEGLPSPLVEEFDYLLHSRLGTFVPHALETIAEVDGENAYAQGWRPTLKRQQGTRALRLQSSRPELEPARAEIVARTGLPKKDMIYPFFHPIGLPVSV